jgi:hypothetical protein
MDFMPSLLRRSLTGACLSASSENASASPLSDPPQKIAHLVTERVVPSVHLRMALQALNASRGHDKPRRGRNGLLHTPEPNKNRG